VQIGNKDSCGKYNKKFFQIPLNMIAHWKFFFCWLEIPRWPLQWDNLIGNLKMATTMRQSDWKSQDDHYNETIWLEIPRLPLQWDNLIGNPKMATTMRQFDWKSQDGHYNETIWLEIQDGHYNETIWLEIQDGLYNETIWLEIPRWPLQWDNLIGNPKMATTMRQSDWKSQDGHYNETVWLEIPRCPLQWDSLIGNPRWPLQWDNHEVMIWVWVKKWKSGMALKIISHLHKKKTHS
jgi:hypothetical protein